MQVKAVSHILYPVWDVEASVAFFVDALGFVRQPRGNITYARLGDVLVEFARTDPPAEPPTGYVFGVEVDDIDEAVAELTAKGAEVIRPIFEPTSFWGRQAVVSVPGAPPLALREYRAPDGPRFEGWTPKS